MAETVAELDGEDLDEDLAAIAGDDLRSLATEDQKVEPPESKDQKVESPESKGKKQRKQISAERTRLQGLLRYQACILL